MWNVVCGGTELVYKHSGVVSSETSFVEFYNGKGSETGTFSNRHDYCFKVAIENGGTKNQKLLDLSKEIWAYLFSEITLHHRLTSG